MCHKTEPNQNNCIWSIDGILTDTTNPGHRGSGSNGHEEVLHVS